MIWTYRYVLVQLPVAALLIAFFLFGCSLSPSAEFIEALGKDPATVCFQITSVYGTVRFARTAIPAGSINCSGEGLSVKSDAATAGVPITVVPQITIGAPTVK